MSLCVAAITLGILAIGRRWPGLAIAWIGYLVILAPNLGIVRIGNQLAADRYCYVASMSLAAVLAYGLALALPWIERRRHRVVALALISSFLIATFSILSWRQLPDLGDNRCTLAERLRPRIFRRCRRAVLHGAEPVLAGDDRAAMEYYVTSAAVNPMNPDAHNLMGAALLEAGPLDEALREVAEAVRLEPRYAAAQNDLGSLLAGRVACRRRSATSGRPSSSSRTFPWHAAIWPGHFWTKGG